MQWFVIAGVVSVVAVLVVLVIRWEASRRENFRDAWRRYAQARGLRWIEASGPWYRRTSDAVDGSVEGVAMRLDTYVVSTGKSHITYTRMRCGLDSPFPGKLVATPRSFWTGIAERFGSKSIRTGDSAFDQRIRVRSKTRDAALRVLDGDVRSRLRTLPSRVSTQISGNEAKIWWHGAETDPAVLDSVAGLVAALARACAKA